MAHNTKDMTGLRFGRLAVLSRAGSVKQSATWLCRCDCGVEKAIIGSFLRSGRTTSCGCYKRELHTTHGASDMPEYIIWTGMKARAVSRIPFVAKSYLERGIAVCERWMSFENFYADMGPRPSNEHTLDRMDNSRGYEPGNCRWATWTEQANNRRDCVYVTVNGVTKTAKQWSEYTNTPYKTILNRARRGWPHEEIVFGRRRSAQRPVE